MVSSLDYTYLERIHDKVNERRIILGCGVLRFESNCTGEHMGKMKGQNVKYLNAVKCGLYREIN